MAENKEVERKFLVAELPVFKDKVERVPIRQGYLLVTEQREVRVRQFGKEYFLTVKTGTGLVRGEIETTLDRRQFETLWPATLGQRVEKERTIVAQGNHRLEIDAFKGDLQGLLLAEVEFEDPAQAMAFMPPLWFGPEVGDDPLFSNKNLASLTAEAARGGLGSLLEQPSPAYGCIPYVVLNGKTLVVVVSNKAGNRWLLPKGSPEPGMEPEQVARMEALEEAGVEGTIQGSPKVVHYWRDRKCYRILYFTLMVSTMHMTWEEEKVRSRKLCTKEEAKQLLDHPGMADVLEATWPGP